MAYKVQFDVIAAPSDFELPTLNHFIGAAMSGVMPGGEKTALPLFPKDDLVRLNTKYTDWAPEPWSKLPPRPTPLGPMPGDSPPPLFRTRPVVGHLGGYYLFTQSGKLTSWM
jgi:hypothetical protein